MYIENIADIHRRIHSYNCMLTHTRSISHYLRQYLQKLVVGKKEKTREVEPFHLEVVIQSLGDFLQLLVRLLELLLELLVRVRLGHEVWVDVAFRQNFPP